MTEYAYMLRTCAEDMTARGGFVWPAEGPVQCDDWSPEAECGHGLHGLLWGDGASGLLDWSDSAKWLVVAVLASDVVDLGGKIKVQRGWVVHCGDRDSAVVRMVELAPPKTPVVGAQITAGDDGTATAGNYGTATAGNYGTATAGSRGTATAGAAGTATAGNYGTATAGSRGTATAGANGIVQIRWYDASAGRYRIAVGYVGEDSIEADVAYRVDGGTLVSDGGAA